MTELHSMPMFWAEFFADTEHMSPEAAKAHLFLIGHAWIRRARLPNNDAILARVARVSARQWASLKEEVLPLWQTLDDGSYSQKRMLKEYDFVCTRAKKNRENGAKGGRPKSDKNGNEINETDNPVGFSGLPQTEPNLHLHLHTSSTLVANDKPSGPKRVRTKHSYSDKFEEFWKAYPTDANMSKHEAFAEWKKLPAEDHDAALVSCAPFRRFCASNADYRPIHACRYLAKRRFDGHNQTAVAVARTVFVKMGTPQWESWDRWYRRTKNISPPVNKEGTGWNFPFEWPADMPARGVA